MSDTATPTFWKPERAMLRRSVADASDPMQFVRCCRPKLVVVPRTSLVLRRIGRATSTPSDCLGSWTDSHSDCRARLRSRDRQLDSPGRRPHLVGRIDDQHNASDHDRVGAARSIVSRSTIPTTNVSVAPTGLCPTPSRGPGTRSDTDVRRLHDGTYRVAQPSRSIASAIRSAAVATKAFPSAVRTMNAHPGVFRHNGLRPVRPRSTHPATRSDRRRAGI